MGPLVTQHFEEPFWCATVILATLLFRAGASLLGSIVVAPVFWWCVPVMVFFHPAPTAPVQEATR
jgi:hypothetical protein